MTFCLHKRLPFLKFSTAPVCKSIRIKCSKSVNDCYFQNYNNTGYYYLIVLFVLFQPAGLQNKLSHQFCLIFPDFRQELTGILNTVQTGRFTSIHPCMAVTCENRIQLVEEELLLNSFHYIFFLFLFFPFCIFRTLDFSIRTTYFSFQ